MAGLAGGRGRWRTLGDPDDAVGDGEEEETPDVAAARPRGDADEDCQGPETRSLWFGVVPTYSGEHWLAPQRNGKPAVLEPKLDDHAIYEIDCVVRPSRDPDCPPLTWVSAPTEPFRLADPMDPAGTKNRTVTITLPDLRRLAARAGEKQGPGGVRIVTPPESQLMVNPFKGIPGSGSGRVGAGGAICTFAIELFFIVAFFLFLMFLPIVVLVFQLWWMLALRFCIPPRIGFSATADFLATGGLLVGIGADARLRAEFNIALGNDLRDFAPGDQTPDWVDSLGNAKDQNGAFVFKNESTITHAVLVGTDPRDAVQPAPLPRETRPEDPLCRSS